LSLEVAPDRPIGDLCGSCTACLEACPTKALPAPYRLDSNRCISYWTIENRGEIPIGMRAEIGDWVFGCDLCQEVCPVNAGPPLFAHRAFGLPTRRRGIGLEELLLMSRDEYAERFRHSPMKRAKLEGLKRNAVVAMGNRRSRRYLPALERALQEGERDLRAHAAWAVGRIGGEEGLRILRSAWNREQGIPVREAIGAALSTAGSAPPDSSG
jgi:epoxyqueuosine reductase